MRTTVTLDEDVERLLRDDMRRQRRSFKESLNAAVRAGLAASARRDADPIEVKAYPMGWPEGIDPTGFNRLVDEMEIEATLKRMRAFETTQLTQGGESQHRARPARRGGR